MSTLTKKCVELMNAIDRRINISCFRETNYTKEKDSELVNGWAIKDKASNLVDQWVMKEKASNLVDRWVSGFQEEPLGRWASSRVGRHEKGELKAW